MIIVLRLGNRSYWACMEPLQLSEELVPGLSSVAPERREFRGELRRVPTNSSLYRKHIQADSI
jgi:hypothetical protein